MMSKTKLYHTCPTEEPFKCMTGDLSDQGFLVVVDKRTHELLIPKEQETDETLTVLVNPKGAQVQGVSPRPGTRMLDLQPPSSDPMKQAAESIERLRREPPQEES